MNPKRWNGRRSALSTSLAGLLGLAVIGLTGCAPQGMSSEALHDELRRIPGVVAVHLESFVTQNGLDPMRTAVEVEIEVDPAYESGMDDAAELEYLLRVAWGLGPDRPSSAMFLAIDRTTDGKPAGFDPLKGATGLGIAPLTSLIDARSGATRESAMILLGRGADRMALQRLFDLLGPWPGDVPEPPPGLIVPRSGMGDGPSGDPPVSIGLWGTVPATTQDPPRNCTAYHSMMPPT